MGKIKETLVELVVRNFVGARNFKFFGNMNINNTAQDYYTVTSLVPQ